MILYDQIICILISELFAVGWWPKLTKLPLISNELAHHISSLLTLAFNFILTNSYSPPHSPPSTLSYHLRRARKLWYSYSPLPHHHHLSYTSPCITTRHHHHFSYTRHHHHLTTPTSMRSTLRLKMNLCRTGAPSCEWWVGMYEWWVWTCEWWVGMEVHMKILVGECGGDVIGEAYGDGGEASRK